MDDKRLQSLAPRRVRRLTCLVAAAALAAGCAPTRPTVEMLPVRNVLHVVIGDFSGRADDSVEDDLRQEISERDLFILVDPVRSNQLDRAYNANRRRDLWRPVRGADAIITGTVETHGVIYGESMVESALDVREPTGVVEIVFEMADLRTGEVYGSRRVRTVVGPNGDLLGVGGRFVRDLLSDRRGGRGGGDRRLTEDEVVARARKAAVAAFVASIRPVKSRGGRVGL